ncbi:MAG: hypothetical protein KQH83_08995 [Actinobacteria bacterium]|nr:hypothetical protein [Actinomycetota bacterium]
MPSNDPKHGRWILPLIIGAMVLLTFTFVNSLDPAEDAGTTTTTAEPPFPTEPTSSSTTLPPELAAFMVTVDAFETQAAGFGQQVVDINNDWEARSITFSEARTQFNDVKATVQLWEQQVADAAADAPAPLAETYVTFLTETGDLAGAIEDVVLGLEAPDDGTLRRTAVEIYTGQVQDVLDAIADIRTAAEAAAGTTEDTDTTEGDGDSA